MANSEDLGNVYGDQKPSPSQSSQGLGNVYGDQKPAPSTSSQNLGNVYLNAADAPSAGKAPLQNFNDAFSALKQQLSASPLTSAMVEVINGVALDLANAQQFDQLNKLIQSINRVTEKYR